MYNIQERAGRWKCIYDYDIKSMWRYDIAPSQSLASANASELTTTNMMYTTRGRCESQSAVVPSGLIIGTGYRVPVFALILDGPVGLWAVMLSAREWVPDWLCIAMAQHKTAVTPLLTHWSYSSLVLSSRCDYMTKEQWSKDTEAWAIWSKDTEAWTIWSKDTEAWTIWSKDTEAWTIWSKDNEAWKKWLIFVDILYFHNEKCYTEFKSQSLQFVPNEYIFRVIDLLCAGNSPVSG